MKIVLDTNVLISGMLNAFGPPGRIIDLLRSGELRLTLDDRILLEYTEVLRGDYFLRYFGESEREDIIEFLVKNSCYTLSNIVASDLPDPDDLPFLEIALTAAVPLITGNLKHYPEESRMGCGVVSPRQFIDGIFVKRHHNLNQ